MSKKPADKLTAKRAAWLERTQRILEVDERTALHLLNQERQQSIRINPLVAPLERTLSKLHALGWQGEPYSWAPNGFSVDSDIHVLRDDDICSSGEIYIQNASSWLPVLMLNPQPGDTVLDVCAAPGGKSSHIAAITGNQATLTVNDNSRARLAKMHANFKRLGVQADYLLYDASKLSRRLEGEQFDKILLDAPCSGEGLMRYNSDKDMATWSVAQIRRLQSLQKRLLLEAWRLLKPGGTLVYSTCTMAPEENEAVVDYLLRKQPDAAVEPINLVLPNRVGVVTNWNDKPYNPDLQGCIRLAPSARLEAFFVCKLKKLADMPESMV